MPDVRRFLSILAAGLLVACGSDRSAGGTTGTEAGNALAVTLTLPGGAPAARASVVLRPSDAVDPGGVARWIRGVADENGRLDLRFGDGAWTMEARCAAYALVADFHGGSDTSIHGSLVGIRTLRGRVLGAADARLALPGLGRSVALDADGSFRIDSIPAQSVRLRVDGTVEWAAPADSGSFVIAAGDPGALYLDPVRFSVAGSGAPQLAFVLDSLVPEGATLLDASGSALPLRLGGVSEGMRRLWVRIPAGDRTVVLCRRQPPAVAVSDSVFRSDGTRMELVPDLDSTLADLSGAGGRFLATGVRASDSSRGAVLDASLGGSIGTIQNGLLDTGSFAISWQARLRTTGIESLWLLDWTDSTGSGLRVGVGGRRLVFKGGGIDTSVAWDPGQSWFGLALSWDGHVLSISCDGATKLRLSPSTSMFAKRSSWTRREVGLGGGLRLGRLSIRSTAPDPDLLSRASATFSRLD